MSVHCLRAHFFYALRLCRRYSSVCLRSVLQCLCYVLVLPLCVCVCVCVCVLPRCAFLVCVYRCQRCVGFTLVLCLFMCVTLVWFHHVFVCCSRVSACVQLLVAVFRPVFPVGCLVTPIRLRVQYVIFQLIGCSLLSLIGCLLLHLSVDCFLVTALIGCISGVFFSLRWPLF